MPKIKCSFCSLFFHVKPSRIKRFNVQFCSRTCQSNFKKESLTVTCIGCSKKFVGVPSNNQPRKYCSHMCYTTNREWKYGKDHHNWKNGETAYRRIAKENLSSFCFLCKSNKNIEVHHLNGDRSNNEITNLAMLCRRCHKDTHWGKTIFSSLLPFRDPDSDYAPPF